MSLAQIRLGTAPDSWGVWFPDDPQQVPWHRFLDEAAAAGYAWIELGPYGYLPTDPERLRDELAQRDLRLSGGAVFAGLHRGVEALRQAVEDCRQEARLLTELGARHLVLLPEGYTDLEGNLTQPPQLTAEQWSSLCAGMSELGKMVADEYGIALVFHPHADSHVGSQAEVERFLDSTDAATVNLCLDTGHISYCGGDNLAIIERFPERIGYLHLKQVDTEVLRLVRSERLCFAEAVRRGVMTEPPNGVPAMSPVLERAAALGVDLFAIVEQDLYPCDADLPFPIARRTAGYLGSCGLGPVRSTNRSARGSLQKGTS
jgi:inosose dehydratase